MSSSRKSAFFSQGAITPSTPKDSAMPNFIPDSKSPIIGLSTEVSFVNEFFRDGGQNR